jgi:glycosyltransferase involved in cell wall biosynthesis
MWITRLHLSVGIIKFCLLFFLASELFAREPVEFAIVIASYNNEKWCIGNLDSCVRQTYKNFTIYYVDDCSRDRTGALVEAYVRSHHLESKCVIIRNRERIGSALANYYKVITMLPAHVVVLTVDGDDRLAHPYVLEKLARVYSSGTTWLTYGNYKSDPPGFPICTAPIPKLVQEKNEFRKYPWVTSHLRTFYAGLFQRIKRKDLLWQGRFFPMTWDLAMMFPMLEMASRGHITFTNEIFYIYNTANPINDFRVNVGLQAALDHYIRTLPRYTPLVTLF